MRKFSLALAALILAGCGGGGDGGGTKITHSPLLTRLLEVGTWVSDEEGADGYIHDGCLDCIDRALMRFTQDSDGNVTLAQEGVRVQGNVDYTETGKQCAYVAKIKEHDVTGYTNDERIRFEETVVSDDCFETPAGGIYASVWQSMRVTGGKIDFVAQWAVEDATAAADAFPGYICEDGLASPFKPCAGGDATSEVCASSENWNVGQACAFPQPAAK